MDNQEQDAEAPADGTIILNKIYLTKSELTEDDDEEDEAKGGGVLNSRLVNY
jgi:hypothetical protein